jgi:hypothetical protein
MKYWLLGGGGVHSTDIHPNNLGKAWPYFPVKPPDERLKGGDVVYLSFGGMGLYAWGHVGKKEKQKDEYGNDAFKVTVRWAVMNPVLVPHESIDKTPDLDGLFTFPNGNLQLLTVAQIKALNRLIQMKGEEAPPDPSELDEDSLYEILHAGRPKSVPTFVHNKPLVLEETRYVELKEVVGPSVLNSVKNTVTEYAVALLNVQGGRIFWGVRNSDRVVVGLTLTYTQRDEIKREVTSKLSRIQPPVSMQELSLEFYPVQDEQGQVISDLYVFEVDVPRGSPSQLYATGSHEVWIKTDAGKQRLTHDQVIAEILRRRGR